MPIGPRRCAMYRDLEIIVIQAVCVMCCIPSKFYVVRLNMLQINQATTFSVECPCKLWFLVETRFPAVARAGSHGFPRAKTSALGFSQDCLDPLFSHSHGTHRFPSKLHHGTTLRAPCWSVRQRPGAKLMMSIGGVTQQHTVVRAPAPLPCRESMAPFNWILNQALQRGVQSAFRTDSSAFLSSTCVSTCDSPPRTVELSSFFHLHLVSTARLASGCRQG